MKTFAALLFLLLCISACTKQADFYSPSNANAPVSISVPDNDHLLLGNPTDASLNPQYTLNYLKNNGYYIISYNDQRGIPTWVSWHLQSEDYGAADRQSAFKSDQLPAGFYRVSTNSYTNTGFDRGHNCPSADRTISVEANASTFLMTNIIPQAPSLNRGPWAGFEEHLRNQLDSTKEAFIIMGNFGTGGAGSKGAATSFDDGKVVVPSYLWKAAVIIKKGDNDLQRIDTSAKVIAILLPNQQVNYENIPAVKSSWQTYTTTIAKIEEESARSGIKLQLLSNLPAAVSSYLKVKK